jgi:hypothetical protein
MRIPIALLLILLAFVPVLAAQAQAVRPALPAGAYGDIPTRFAEYDVILRPDESTPEWWAGAPSVVRDKDGIFWMACRMRRADAPRGLRGYELRILRSEDGSHFEKVLSIPRESVPIPGFERPALLQDPATGKFKLYACGPWQEGPWCIIKFADADRPELFDPASARPVITAPPRTHVRDVAPIEFKDPVIYHDGKGYHAFVTGYVRQNERIYHFQSTDGEQWSAVGNPLEPRMDLAGWHDFFVRPASVLPLGVGYLFIYEGSDTSWHDPVYNIGTGLAYTFDLHNMQDLTLESPLLLSNTPNEHFATFRYSHWMWVEDEVWVYAEVACPDQTHEIRRYRARR